MVNIRYPLMHALMCTQYIRRHSHDTHIARGGKKKEQHVMCLINTYTCTHLVCVPMFCAYTLTYTVCACAHVCVCESKCR